MDKSGLTNNIINKKSRKNSNALYLIIKNSPGLIRHNTEKNFINISSKSQRSAAISDSLYFWQWSSINSESINAINNSITVKLTGTLLQNTSSDLLNGRSEQCLSGEVYGACINNLSNLFDDNELLLLYLKQAVLILRGSSIFDTKDNTPFIEDTQFWNVQLYLKMLNSFWNRINWAMLFVSMPETASNLMKNRNLLLDLLNTKKEKFRIDWIANAFFNKTGLGRENDILLISFLDFGVFTWLSHFGIINYLNGTDKNPVFIEVTKLGKRMLEYLSLG
jgi:hypothetical protein